MTEHHKTLVVGATGNLGSEIVRLLREAGKKVHATARHGSHAGKRRLLEEIGSEIVLADLKDRASLDAACAGATCVISTANTIVSRQEGDSIESVDERGQLALVDAARHAGVKHFVFISFPLQDVDSAFQRSKRAVERKLAEGTMPWTIIQATAFMEVWLTPALGFDPVSGRARVFGSGARPVSWVSLHDVARFAAAASHSPAFVGRTVRLGGPDALSPLQVIEIFEQLGCPKVTVEHVPEEALQAQLAAPPNALAEAFAASMLNTARGQVVEPDEALALLPGQLTTVRNFATRMVAASLAGGV
jgi:NADH dehydrogenase